MQTLGIGRREDLTAVYACRLDAWEQAYEVKDEFSLRGVEQDEVAVLALGDLFG